MWICVNVTASKHFQTQLGSFWNGWHNQEEVSHEKKKRTPWGPAQVRPSSTNLPGQQPQCPEFCQHPRETFELAELSPLSHLLSLYIQSLLQQKTRAVPTYASWSASCPSALLGNLKLPTFHLWQVSLQDQFKANSTLVRSAMIVVQI